jgi:general secretion pathway protein D
MDLKVWRGSECRVRGVRAESNRPTTRGTPVRCAWLALAVALALAGCAQQRIRTESQGHLNEGDYEQAVAVLTQGLVDHTDSTLLRAGLIQARNEALTRLVVDAASARSAGRLDDAEAILRRALAFDSAGRAQSLLDELVIERRQRKSLADAQSLLARKQADAALRLVGEALKDNPRNAELLALQRRLAADARDRQVFAAQSGLAESRPISLDFRDANLRTVLDMVSRHSGLNFILDKDIRSDVRVSVFLRSARVEDAIDLIVSTNQLAKKVLDDRTILVYPSTPEKLREHQEQVVRVFYLASADAKGAAAFLRSMLRLREPFVDERVNMVALRESPDNIALAERLIALYDGQDPEVLLELEVMEIRSSRLTDLGIKFPDTFVLTAFPPSGSTSITLGNIDNLTRNDIRVAFGSAVITLKREVGDFTTLANPRIRARNREKAKVLIGDKVPVVTATTGQTGFVAESVSYLDVGLKLDVEPTVYPDNEVAIKVALEVSSIAREVRTASGSLAYQIGTRNASTVLRLRDGETQLLAGLISREDRSTASRIPGLGDLPVMGRLFSSQADDSQRTELVLAITPRVLRNVRPLDASEAEIWVGTDTQPRLRPYGGRAGPVDVLGDKGGAGAAQPSATAATPGDLLRSPARAAAPTTVATATATRLRGPSAVNRNDVFVVSLDVDAPLPLRGGPIQVAYSKDSLSLLEVEEGDWLKQGGAPTSFTRTIDAAQGAGQVGLLRSQATGATGQGTLVTLRFKAIAAGDAEVRIAGFEPVVLGGVPTSHQAGAPLRVQVKP